MGPRAAPPAVPAPVPLGACSGGSRQAAAAKGGDEQGAAGRGDDGGKGRKRAEETTAAGEGEKNGDGKGRRRGEETPATKGREKNHAQRGRLFLGLVWQGTGGRVKTTADVVITGRAGWHVLPPCRRNCPAPCANHGANAPTYHNTPTPRPGCPRPGAQRPEPRAHEHAPRRPAVHGPAGALKSALSLIGRVKNTLIYHRNYRSTYTIY